MPFPRLALLCRQYPKYGPEFTGLGNLQGLDNMDTRGVQRPGGLELDLAHTWYSIDIVRISYIMQEHGLAQRLT